MYQSIVRISKLSEVSDKLNCPVAASFLGNTDLIIAIDHNSKSVYKVLDLNSNECVYSFGSYGTGIGQFLYPVSISMIGNVLCIADFNRNVIVMLTYDGDLISEVDLNYLSRINYLSHSLHKPWSLCYSANSASLYAAFLVSNRVVRLSSQLPFQITFGRNVLVQPLCVCVGENEIIFVLDKTTSIRCFQEDGTYIGTILLIKIHHWCSESLVRFVIDTKGNFILCPSSINAIVVFSPAGEQIFPVTRETQEFAFDSPLDISLGHKGRKLVVSDTFNEKVQLFDYSID